MIKFILRKAVLLLFFISVDLMAQTPVSITKPEAGSTDYIVSGNVTLIATQSMTLKPNTFIQSGSTFVAKIIPDAYASLALSNENYIFTRSYQKAMTSSSGISENSDVIEGITYFDGLGRPMQNIAVKGSPGIQDIVTHIGYDDFGRQHKEYLPYMSSAGAIGSYRTSGDVSTKSYYVSNYLADINSTSPNPFSEKQFEASPLNRILKQAAPGSAWALNSGHEMKMDYQANAASEVKLFTANTTWNTSLGVFDITLGNASGTSFYAPGELYKTVTKNENWSSGNENTIEEFKDKEGRVILKKTYGVSLVNGTAVSTSHETYYIYDIYGNLTYVLPPKADGSITASVLSDFCYQYKYDNLKRLVEKKLPGKEWEYTVYDKLDRPVLTQDANLRVNNKWVFTKYDAFGRTAYTGEYVNTTQTTRIAVQGLANGTILFENKSATAIPIAGTNVNYTNAAFPTTGIDLWTIIYYDNYLNFDLDGGTTVASYGITPIINAKGLTTCSKVRILDSNPAAWTTHINYYDGKGRPIYNYSKNNFLSTVNTSKSQLDFAGKTIETTITHKKGNAAEIVVVDSFTYDHMGRILTRKQKINSQTQETIAMNSYDNLGQLILKGVGGTGTSVQTVNYGYNIRGWLKNINDVNALGTDLFAFGINYNAPSTGTALFNGNISQTLWRTAGQDNSLRSYSYSYDALNRLTAATDNIGRYNENPSYDKNGNIMKLFRNGNTVLNTSNYGSIDNLVYTYGLGNKLTKVEDTSGNTQGFSNGSTAATEYTYDDNGNMKTDANKGINTSIVYNYLNLPTQVTLPGGTINYTYDATGVKQRKVAGTITTDYADGFQYENNTLQFFPHPEGYVRNNSGVYEYIYQYKDHLGNIRLSYNKNLNIIEENNYYPFGLEQKSHTNIVNTIGNAAAQKYKYNGKELQDDNIGGSQFNVYDYGKRMYDPSIGRFLKIDRLAEKYHNLTPYSYAGNNPIYFVDIQGDSIKPNIVVVYSKEMNPRKSQKGHDFGITKLKGATPSFNSTTKNVDLTVEIQITYSSILEEENFNKDNPGFKNEVEQHETGHKDQILEAFSTEITLEYENKTYKGSIDKIADDMIANGVKGIPMPDLINLATENVNKTYPPGSRGAENDADKRAKKNGSTLEYTNGKKPVKI